MTEQPQPGRDGPEQRPDDALAPLAGETIGAHLNPLRRAAVSKKGLLAVCLLMGSLVAVSATGLQRFLASGRKAGQEDSQLMRDKPTTASAEPRKLEMPTAPSSAEATLVAVRVPAITPTDDELVEPIGLRTGSATAPGKGGPMLLPEDAPVLVASSRAVVGGGSMRSSGLQAPLESGQAGEPGDALAATSRNLQNYQRQLQGVLENLTRAADNATAGSPALLPSSPMTVMPGAGSVGAASAGLFGGQLQGAGTAKVAAGLIGHRSLTLARGTAFTCALKTRVISAVSGLVGCQVQRNVFGDDGRVLLIERGSHLDGEYRIASVRPGMVRIPVLWTRIRTPLGVTVDIESPATGGLGESGIDGHVDNRWSERIGAAMLLSVIDDSIKLVAQNQGNERQGDTIVLPSTTNNASKLAEKVLDSTINIPPLIYQNQGAIVGIHVARDVDFSSVYELLPTNVPPRQP